MVLPSGPESPDGLERGESMHTVIINADDFGFSRGINYGIIDSYKYGILTSTTLMANMPGFEHAVSLAGENPGLGVGVHLNLTCGYPLLKGHRTIVDPDTGRFKNHRFYETPDFQVDPEEVYREWDAQIRKVLEAGIQPTHLDSHHHTHSYGTNREVAIELARKYRLPLRNNFQGIPDDIVKTERFEPNFDLAATMPELLAKPYLHNLLADFETFASIELMCHPGYLDQVVIDESSLRENRTYMANFLMHSEFSRELKSNKKIRLGTYRDLQN